jgi:drug/metabolite transporter (DMT)-like permease
MKHTQSKALFALFILSLFWGYNWVVMKKALAFAGVFQFVALRTVIGAACLFLIMLVLRKPFSIAEKPSVLLLGLLQTSGFTGLLMWALVDGGAGKTSVLTFTMPFWVMLLAWPMLGEKLKGLQWPAAALAVLGLGFILDPFHLSANHLSMLLAVLSGVCWALAVIVAKKLHAKAPTMDLLSLTAWQMLFGSIPIVVVAYLVPAPPIQWTPYFTGAVLFNSVICNALAWLLWLYALQRLQAGVATMSSLLIPVIAVLAAWVQLQEAPEKGELIGMGLIGLALVLISYVSIKKQAVTELAMGQD